MSGPRMTDERFEALWRASGESSNTVRLAREAKRARTSEAELVAAALNLVPLGQPAWDGLEPDDEVTLTMTGADMLRFRAALAQATPPRPSDSREGTK